MDDVQMHVMFLDLHSDFDATPNQNSVSVVESISFSVASSHDSEMS